MEGMKQRIRKRGKFRGKMGHPAPSHKHFTGQKGGTGPRIRRKGKGLTRRQRKMKRGNHQNKYA